MKSNILVKDSSSSTKSKGKDEGGNNNKGEHDGGSDCEDSKHKSFPPCKYCKKGKKKNTSEKYCY